MPLFAHARNYPLLNTCLAKSGRGARNTYPRDSPSHTAFVLQEAIQSISESGKKAYVALLDVKKAFDTVWHQGLSNYTTKASLLESGIS